MGEPDYGCAACDHACNANHGHCPKTKEKASWPPQNALGLQFTQPWPDKGEDYKHPSTLGLVKGR